MTEQNERIEIIKTRLGITDDIHGAVLSDMFGQYLSVAKSICGRQDEPLAMLDIVQDIVAGAYNQRGGEGFASSNTGSQKYDNINLHDELRKNLINAGLRTARF